MKKLLLFLFLLIATISKAQIGGGYDQAMNFGGAGSEVRNLVIANNGDTYFLAATLGKSFFAGQEIDAGGAGSFPYTKFIYGKISNTGTQTLLKILPSGAEGAALDADGNLAFAFTGSALINYDFGNGITDNSWGFKLAKISNTGVTQWIKPINTGSSVAYGNSGIAIPNVAKMQITPDGNIYMGVAANNQADNPPTSDFKYPHRIIKYDASGNEVWHNELFSKVLFASISLPTQFVSNNGKLSFGIVSNTNQWYFNGENIASQMSNYANSAYTIIVNLNTDGTKNFTITDGISGSSLASVNPTTGDLYVYYASSTVNSLPSKAPFTSLPNLYPPNTFNYYLFQGLLTFNTSGTYLGYTTKYSSDSKLYNTANGFLVYELGFTNSIIDKGGDYVFNSPSLYGVISFYDSNFNFLKAIKTPRLTTINTLADKVVIGGDFKGNLTFGSTTLIQSSNDADFQTRFPSFASVKADLYIAKADVNNIVPPPASNWLGVDNNWNNSANWSGGIVPDANTIVKFNSTTANMPTVATSPTALKVTIDAGVTASLPMALVIKNKLIINGTLQINHTGALNFTNYSATAIEGTGTLAFNGTNTPSVTAYSLVGYKDLSLSTNEDITLAGIYKSITFTGTNAIITASAGLEITNPDVNAISGYSATNYIAGKITRAVNANGTYVFPNSQFSYLKSEPTTLTLNNLTGTTKITVANNNGPGTIDLNLASGTTTTALGVYYWRITPDVAPTGGSYDASFSKSVFSNGVTDANRYVVLKRIDNNNPWTFEGTKTTSTQTGGTTSGQTVIDATVVTGLSGLTKFSDFVIGINSTAVPNNTTVTTSIWNGNANTTWNNTGNWSNGIPNSTVDAIIPSGLLVYPLVYAAADNARSLTIQSGITGLRLHSGLKLTSGLINNSNIEIARLEGFDNVFAGYKGGISGNGKIRFEATGNITSTTAGVVNNDLDVNIGNTNAINLLGKFGGNINIITGLVNAVGTGTNFLEQTNPSATIQITSSINALAAEKLSKTVNTTGNYTFPLGDYNYTSGRKYGEIGITNNNISSATIYSIKFASNSTVPVSFVNGTDVYSSFINSGQWSITPTNFSSSGSIDLSLKTSNYTNGRVNINDYVLLRRASTATNTSDAWVIVSGASISESAGLITVTATGLAPFSTNTMFCIGLKATTTTWTGAAGTANWNTASNWSNGVPTAEVKAVIGNVTSGRLYPNNAPTSGSAAAAIEIASGSTLTLPSTFYTPTGIINNGTINISGSGIFYGFGTGATYSNITGTGKLVFGNSAPSSFDSYYMNQVVNNSIEVNKTGGISLNRTTSFGGNVDLVNGILTMASGQNFNMTNPNATISSTTTSYINGNLQRTVNTSGTYNFPVGLATVYAPTTLNLSNLVGTTTITASFSSAAISGQPSLTISGQTVNSILSSGSWEIAPNVQPTAGTYNATLSAPIGSSTANNYYVLKRPGNYGAWLNLGTNITSTVIAGVITASTTGLTSFSQFGIGEGFGTLPVKMVKFLATADVKAAKLYWETASELNNDKFEIERSINGTDFIKIGTIKGNGTSQKLNTYNFKDLIPQNGVNYYRLKQVDLNGNFEYSEIKFVNFDFKDLVYSIYPNPVTDVINFSEAVKSVEIFNLSGAKVYQQNEIVSNVKIPLEIKNGVYILRALLLNGSSISKQILINK